MALGAQEAAARPPSAASTTTLSRRTPKPEEPHRRRYHPAAAVAEQPGSTGPTDKGTAITPDCSRGGARTRRCGGCTLTNHPRRLFLRPEPSVSWCSLRGGVVLAVLAMLTPKWALRVAPGGSAPPIPSAARRVALLSCRDKQAPQRNWKAARVGGPSVISTLRTG
jgi:hypothetical protein